MSYRFHHGDRPLDGYTVLRGLGRGGFGEVYYAVSDGGREVALKVILQNHDIELRGVRHCMNLKSPHLVCIFDVKTASDGFPVVIMEYVSGPSLRQILTENPGGLGTDRASHLIERIAQGLRYLHDHGIVHRDLKPENIFYEDGFAKIGDYGLSKFISVSRQSGQTISVGTVHYMAPEVGSGNYSAGIDIYALGVIYYELLTGTVPFDGDSMAEILMKHLTAAPDLGAIEPAFRPLLSRALAKNPKDRHASVQEFLDQLLAIPALEDRIASVSAESFAASAAPRSATAAVSASAETIPSPGARAPLPGAAALAGSAAATAAAAKLAGGAPLPGEAPVRKAPAAGPVAAPAAADTPATPSRDEVRRDRVGGTRIDFRSPEGSRRIFHGLMTILAMGLAMALFESNHQTEHFIAYSVLIGLGSMALLLVEGWVAPRFSIDMGIARRLTTLAVVGPVLAIGYSVLHKLMPRILQNYEQSFMGLFLGLVLLDWTVRARPDRKEQISLESAFFAGIFALVVGAITDGGSFTLLGLFVAMSLTLNALTPCTAAERRTKRNPVAPPPRERARSPAATAPAAEVGSRSFRALFWLAVVASLMLLFRSGPVLTVAVLGALAVFFAFGRRRHSQRRPASSAGWTTLGALLVLTAVVLALVGGVLDSDLGAQLLKETNASALTDFMSVGGSGNGFYLFVSVATLLFVPAMICLLMGRRWAGSGHVIRGAVGLASLAALVWIVAVFLAGGPIVLEKKNLVLRQIPPDEWKFLILSTGLLGILSAVTLAWPGSGRAGARRET